MTRLTVTLCIIALALVSVGADYLLKRASDMAAPFKTRHFVSGCLLYALSAPGWVLLFKHSKLATIGAVYSIVVVLVLAVLGVVVFRETLSTSEVIGLGFAVTALAMLSRSA
jgi:undecaprenyl phosphate-alpha-L-ara4N flippase subunit ArnF